MVRMVGVEPTQPEGNGFTAHPNSPCLEHPHYFQTDLDLVYAILTDCVANRIPLGSAM